MTSLDDYFQSLRDKYAQEVAQGLHDEKCEHTFNVFMCHCSKRRREAAGHVGDPGLLEFAYPTCRRCLEEVDGDGDGFWCDRCHISYRLDGRFDHYTDDYGYAFDRKQVSA